MEVIGYSPGLVLEDCQWLLADAPHRENENERRLAINSALRLWREAGSPPALQSQIEAVARSDAAMRETYENGLRPVPKSQALIAQEEQLDELRRQAGAKQAERDRARLEFIEGLRKDPDQLRHVRPPTAGSVDGRLYHLWKLLSDTIDANTRYAIDSVAPLEPIVGEEVAAASQDGLIKYWRLWKPKLKSTRGPDERNQINSVDCMGIAGVSLEARTRPHWAEHLSSEEACLAASYATLEINGFPSWFSDLAKAKPTEVRSILTHEVASELADPEPRQRYEVLEDVARAGTGIAELVAPFLLEELKKCRELPLTALQPVLTIIVCGLRDVRNGFGELAIERFNRISDARVAGLYLAAASRLDPGAATTALAERLERLQIREQKALVEQILPSIFGTPFPSDDPRLDFPFESLERLVGIAFKAIRVDEDLNRPSGQMHFIEGRDNAEHARGVAFDQLAQRPGRATYDALLRLGENPDCPIPKRRILEQALERAARDSEAAPWLPSDTLAFEQTSETAPSTSKDLQRVALRRLDDIQSDLLHADFAQGATVKALPNEEAVQIWIADRLRLKQGRSFSVEREVHVADKKEPDIRIRAKASDSSVAIEVKVAESWTIAQLEAALRDQLCGQYLRARDGRHGILLLVHQEPRKRGWELTTGGGFLTFDSLVTHLRAIAAKLAGAGQDAPEPEVAVVNVSSCASAKKGRKRNGNARSR